MTKVLKESFYEASFKVNEEFDNAEIAAQSDKPSEMAKLDVLDIKFSKSKITLKNKEQDGSEKGQGTKASAGGGIKKDE